MTGCIAGIGAQIDAGATRASLALSHSSTRLKKMDASPLGLVPVSSAWDIKELLPRAMNDRRFFDENGHDHVLIHFTSLFMYLHHLINTHIAYHVS